MYYTDDTVCAKRMTYTTQKCDISYFSCHWHVSGFLLKGKGRIKCYNTTFDVQSPTLATLQIFHQNNVIVSHIFIYWNIRFLFYLTLIDILYYYIGIYI